MPWIDTALEATIRNATAAQAERLRCPLRAFGAFDDHVHAALDLHRTVSLSVLLRALKGASGHDAARARPELAFRWQEGYGAFSISERDPEAVIAYVRGQRERHAAGDLISALESGLKEGRLAGREEGHGTSLHDFVIAPELSVEVCATGG